MHSLFTNQLPSFLSLPGTIAVLCSLCRDTEHDITATYSPGTDVKKLLNHELDLMQACVWCTGGEQHHYNKPFDKTSVYIYICI